PDIISQTLLALPMWLLFEIGVIFGRIMKRKREEAATEEEEEAPLSDEEMEAEFDRAIAEEETLNPSDDEKTGEDERKE
ncbi:MAG: twin-arginine translocase subunit TatC, partial [Thiohalophilus sp.]